MPLMKKNDPSDGTCQSEGPFYHFCISVFVDFCKMNQKVALKMKRMPHFWVSP